MLTVDQPTLTYHKYPKSIGHVIALGVACTMCLCKFIMTCIHLYSVLQSIFIVLEILCTPPIHPFLPYQLKATIDIFIVSIVLPFSECPIVGIKHVVSSLFRLAYYT